MSIEESHIQFDIPDKEWAEWLMFQPDVLVFIAKQLQKEGVPVGYIERPGPGVLGTKCTIERTELRLMVWVPRDMADGTYRSAVSCSNYVHWPIWKCLLGRTIPDELLYSGEPYRKLARMVERILSGDCRFHNVKLVSRNEWIRVRVAKGDEKGGRSPT